MSQQLHEVANSNRLTLRCSFCGRTNHECRVMVDGGSAVICDLCIEVASNTLASYSGETEYQSWMRHLTPNDRIQPRR